MDDGANQTLGLPQPQAKDYAHRQRRGDRQGRIVRLAAWRGSRLPSPCLDYLRVVGPFYGCFGVGLVLYFGSPGAGKLLWPVMAGMLRLIVAVAGGAIALRATGSLVWLYVALAIGLAVYGATTAGTIAGGAWFRRTSPSALVRARSTA